MSQIMHLLVQRTGLSVHDIDRIVASAPSRYKVFLIPKRNGGAREIAQPARELKVLQRILIDEFLNQLPIHKSATAYRSGLSIKENALPHAGQGAILKMDFTEFFPSIGAHHWDKYCAANSILPSPEDRWITSRLLFYRKKGQTALRLSIGAPSSPIVSNILMFDFDVAVAEAVAVDRVIYTRYADDLTFSAPRTGYLNAVRPAIDKIISKIRWPDLKINESKTVLATRKYKREVTGLILANDGRVTLGREKKRRIRAAVHHFALGRVNADEAERLAGLLAYVNAVEPEFLRTLKAHYGDGVISAIRQASKR